MVHKSLLQRCFSSNLCLLIALIAGFGSIAADQASSQEFTNLHSFTGLFTSGPGGDHPDSGVILSGNTLYGTAYGGGSSIRGTVFRVNTDGSAFSVLHNFTALEPGPFSPNSDGANPYAGVILSGDILYGTARNGGSSGTGTVFAVNTNGTGFTVLHNFSASTSTQPYINTDGYGPNDLVISGTKLYGTAFGGGSLGGGTAFSVNTDGSEFTILHNFPATSTNTDGTTPVAGLLLSGSTLYGTALYGGSLGSGTVFAVNINGTGFRTLHSFTALVPGPVYTNSDGATPYARLILSGNTLYGTARDGGSSGIGTVFGVNTDGTGFSNLHIFTGAVDGANPVGELIISGNTLCGTANGGGDTGNGTVFTVNVNGTGFRKLYSFTATPNYPPVNIDGAHPQDGLILSSNKLYGTAWSGGSAGNGTVFSLSLPTSAGVPGDANGDGAVTVGDIFYLINHLFAGGPAPIGPGDANADGAVTVGDVFYLINFLFAGGPAPL